MSLTRTVLREQIRALLQMAQELGTNQAPVREAPKEGSREKAGETLRPHFETLRTMMKRGVNA